MGNVIDRVAGYFDSFAGSIGEWLFQLNHEEWMLLLAIVAALGFLCMRGYGSRNKY